MHVSNTLCRAICLFAAIIITYNVKSQITAADGYVVTNESDTVYGKLEYARTGLEDKCVFMRGASTDIEILSPDLITKFYIGPELNFVSHHVEGRDHFLLVIAEGRINLFQNGKDLYISSGQDSIRRLLGGTFRVTRNGKQYYEKVNSYKSQIKRYADIQHFREINEAPFSQESITRIIRKINNQTADSNDRSRVAILNKYHLGVQAGYFTGAFRSVFPGYKDHLFYKDGIRSYRHSIDGWSAGIDVKRKLGRSRSYLQAGANYESTGKSSHRYRWLLHSGFIIPTEGGVPVPKDTIGYIDDSFVYSFSSLSIPVNYYLEASFTRLRPFVSLGISNKILIRNDTYLERNVYVDTALDETVVTRLVGPSYILGPRITLGGRYLVSGALSFSAGITFDSFLVHGTEGGRYQSRQIHLAANF